jgi:D-alanine-D-alanine ligase
MNNKSKKIVAVFFGAKSPEHDVSIVTGLQVIKAIDSSQFETLPVYIAPNGDWLVGQDLLNPANYMFSNQEQRKLDSVTLDLGTNLNYFNGIYNKGRLLFKNKSIFSRKKFIDFDIAVLALHGINSEDGKFAAIMDIANIPYAGMRHFAATLLMNKIASKNLFKSVGIPVLPHISIDRPSNSFIIESSKLMEIINANKLNFPFCAKPCNLGSSIGVAKVNNVEELTAVLPKIFAYDSVAMLEPFVENLIEYNVAVGFIDGMVMTSAIEKPKNSKDLLDFKQKYGSGNSGSKASNKFGSGSCIANAGMLSMTRELNPQLEPHIEQKLRSWAELAFKTVHGSGFPRIDFLCNSQTGDLWLNEINPYPGSFGFYLWEASSKKHILFTELLNLLLKEAEDLHKRNQLPIDPTPIDARLFPRK